MAIKRMNDKKHIYYSFIQSHEETIKKLSSIRNQFEHMHAQIVSGETGNGPILITFSDHGQCINFRKLKLDVVLLHELIKDLYQLIARMYTGFDEKSPLQHGGPIKLSISANIEVFKRDKPNN